MEHNRTAILEDLCRIVSRAEDAGTLLQRMVELLARKLGTDACTVYVLNAQKDYLRLHATVGLNREAAGRIGMHIREGLTGLVLESQKPLFVLHPNLDPRNKFFEGSGEEIYQTYLGIPLVYQGKVLGVLVLQTVREDGVSEDDIPVLSVVAGQISAVLAYTGILENLEDNRPSAPEPGSRGEVDRPRSPRAVKKAMLRGTPVSPGFADGHAHYMAKTIGFDKVEPRRVEDTEAEASRIEKALRRTRQDVEALGSGLEDLSVQDEAILEAQIMYMEDASFKDRILGRIRDGYAAEYALKMALMETVDSFRRMDNRYLQERATEIEDMGLEVLGNLLGIERSASKTFLRDTILIASDISPLDLIGLRQERLKGIVLAGGGKTAHSTILARSLEIPMIIGVRDLLDSVNEGDYLIVDANSGLLFSRPIREIIDEYARLKEEKTREGEALAELRDLPATTRDGREVKLGANIGLLSDIELLDKYGADHIGLYRTEFPFLVRKDFPSEEVQTELYRRILQGTGERVTTIRTLDVGGDKFLSYLDYPRENNPYLGWRSIRVSLDMEGPFRTQVRAVLRASEAGRVKILFPMITSVEEVLRIRQILEEEKSTLSRQGVPFDPAIPVGIMVEVPGTVRILARFLPYVDFVSIGTNDLIQYTLAVDRSNPRVSELYNPLHPAVIALVHDVAAICREHGKEMSICGEAAAQPRCAYLFLGMGVQQLSMNPGSVPIVKRMIRNTTFAGAKEALDRVLGMETAAEVARFLDGILPAEDGEGGSSVPEGDTSLTPKVA